MEGSDQGPVAAVSEGGDDQTSGVAQVLVAVFDGGVGDANHHVALPVVAQLGQPVEIVQGGYTCDKKKTMVIMIDD